MVMAKKNIAGFLSGITLLVFLLALAGSFSSCGIYSFNDKGTIPDSIKTVRVNFIENRAPYNNPQLSPTLTERLKLKILSQTRLTNTTSDNAHYDIRAEIRDYSVTTTGVTTNSNNNGRQEASINRLNVSVHVVLTNTLSNVTKEYDVTRNFDFSAQLTLQQAEGRLLDEIVRNLTDEIFNRIFSEW
jgi:carbon monoxide dehydrogenase subunit G